MSICDIDIPFENDEKMNIISIDKLLKIKEEIKKFKENIKLNNFQKWIINELYNFDKPEVSFSVKSIILIAIPHPFYTEAIFAKNNEKYSFLSLVMSDFDKTEFILKKALLKKGYSIVLADNLPLKRLAVQSGFAVYGRNNICYIDDSGSNFSFIAYFSDIPCDDNYWGDVKLSSLCKKCNICLRNCPTNAIKNDSFLINTEKCLSYWNENSKPFPQWIPKNAHHCLYDCLKCQINCPMNRAQKNKIGESVFFTESETNMLLSGMQFEKHPLSLKKKVKYLGLHQYPITTEYRTARSPLFLKEKPLRALRDPIDPAFTEHQIPRKSDINLLIVTPVASSREIKSNLFQQYECLFLNVSNFIHYFRGPVYHVHIYLPGHAVFKRGCKL